MTEANALPHALYDLALIGDRRTAALVHRSGSVVWYCPERFDAPALLTALLDSEAGGCWTLEPPLIPVGRRYLDESGVLETVLSTPEGTVTVTDWLPLGDGLSNGLCRRFSPVPRAITLSLTVTPDYGRQPPPLHLEGHIARLGSQVLYASHPLELAGNRVSFTLPAGEAGWAFLSDAPLETFSTEALEHSLQVTLTTWDERAARTRYSGPYEREINASLRALRLLTFEETGSVIAAPTTSLPEVIGGARNYDYRYVWLRDAGMIVSAITRAGGDPNEGARFLDFIAKTDSPTDSLPLAPFATPDGKKVSAQTVLGLPGYANSTPVVIGNDANEQLQLDAYGNVLLAAKLLYSHLDEPKHWNLVARLADYLCEHWREPDHGLWEEKEPRQYTSSKVIVACGLRFIADYCPDETQARRWLEAAQDIHKFVAENCLTQGGAYAAVAGEDAVDVSAALFPVWDYTAPDTPEMLATMRVLERDSAVGDLYHRHLFEFDAHQEGAFLAGTLWVAQYWIMRGELNRSRRIIDAVLACGNDLFLLSEEADPWTKRMLGNFPQSFVHAALIGVVIDLKAALEGAE